MHVPERHPADRRALAVEQREQVGVAPRQPVLHVRRQALRPRIEPLPLDRIVGQLQVLVGAHAVGDRRVRQHVDVQFGDHDLDPECGEGVDALLDLRDRRAVDAPVALHADAVDAQPVGLQHFHHAHDAFAPQRVLGAVIVVVQLGVGGIAGGEAERLAHQAVAVADVAQPRTVAVIAVVADDLVGHVPALHLAGVAAGDVLDVVAQAFDLRVGAMRPALPVDEQPWRGLHVPQQRVADDEHAVRATERDDRIARREVVLARPRQHALGLELVLGGDGVELAQHQRLRGGIAPVGHGLVDRRADQEVVAVGGLQRGRRRGWLRGRWRGRRTAQHGGQRGRQHDVA